VFLAHSCRVLGCQVKAAAPGDRHLVRERAADAQEGLRRAERQFRESQAQFTASIDGLKCREGTLLAVYGWFDDDYSLGLEEKFQAVKTKATQTCLLLDKQAEQAQAFAHQLDLQKDNGLTLTINLESSGNVRLVQAKATKSNPRSSS
jgi:hypothetical protein